MSHPHHAAERGGREEVAYDLMRDIMLDDPARPLPSAPEFRAYVLDLYAECLAAVRGRRQTAVAPAAGMEAALRKARLAARAVGA